MILATMVTTVMLQKYNNSKSWGGVKYPAAVAKWTCLHVHLARCFARIKQLFDSFIMQPRAKFGVAFLCNNLYPLIDKARKKNHNVIYVHTSASLSK